MLSNNTEEESTNRLELTKDLAGSLMKTLGKIGGSITIQKENDLQNAGDASKQSGDSAEELEKRSDQFITNVEALSSNLVDNLLPGTKLENIEAGSFSVSGGRFTTSGISNKDLETEEGSKLLMPVWDIGDGNSLIKYKHLVFNKNPRINMTNETIGASQRFTLSTDDNENMEIANLTDPINLRFVLTGLSNTTVEILQCSFYNSTLGRYSVAGITTISKTILPDGNVVISCQSNHLSEYSLATNPAQDTKDDSLTIAENNNIETAAEMDKIDQIDPAGSMRKNLLYIYIYISI